MPTWVTDVTACVQKKLVPSSWDFCAFLSILKISCDNACLHFHSYPLPPKRDYLPPNVWARSELVDVKTWLCAVRVTQNTHSAAAMETINMRHFTPCPSSIEKHINLTISDIQGLQKLHDPLHMFPFATIYLIVWKYRGMGYRMGLEYTFCL